MAGFSMPQTNTDPGLQQTLAFNDLLKSLVNAKVPVLLNDKLEASPERLDEINREIALQVSRGDSVKMALAKCPSLSSFYTDALAAYNQSPDDLRSLNRIQSQVWNHALSSRRFAYSRGKLMVLWLLTGAVFSLLLAIAPRLILQMYELSNAEPGPAALLIKSLADNYVICLTVFAAVAALLFFWKARYFSTSPVPSNSKRGILLHNYFQTAFITKSPEKPTSQNSTPQQDTQLKGEHESTSSLLSWINDPTIPPTEKNNRKTFAAELLNAELAKRNYLQLHTLPIVAHLVPGGLMVLMVSVMLFLPLIELLVAICQP